MNILVESAPLKARFQSIRTQTEELCAPLKTEDYVVQPVDFVSPPKWNIAHVSWFFEEFILKPYHTGYQVFSNEFPYFFNSYYESVGKRTLRAQRGNMTRPTTEEAYQYRHYVDKHFLSFLDTNALISKSLYDLIALGLNHEQQHQELLMTDLKYILGHNPLFPAYLTTPRPIHPFSKKIAPIQYLTIPEGLYEIGHQGDEFHFDNELGRHKVWLDSFRIADRLISNAEYLEFIEAGAYQKFQYWLSAGWEWVKTNQIESPLYWHNTAGVWWHYTLHGLEKVNLNAPVTHLSFYEADAFARWAGKRLPTEFEWETTCRQYGLDILPQSNFLETGFLQPQTATEGNLQFLGDVWEWTSSAYLPYPHYKQAAGAIGEYNGKFMINQMVLRGGSCVTPRSHIRATYRNFFHAHERWQFTGIRLAEYL
jgi:ergothioneine biosynthesis protein EgtB